MSHQDFQIILKQNDLAIYQNISFLLVSSSLCKPTLFHPYFSPSDRPAIDWAPGQNAQQAWHQSHHITEYPDVSVAYDVVWVMAFAFPNAVVKYVWRGKGILIFTAEKASLV